MKERRTYFIHDGESFDPANIVVRGNAVEIKKLPAVKELRRTFTLTELPREVLQLLFMRRVWR